MLQQGTILDNRYHIEAVIGRGGFGYVYRARERLTDEIVAIKELVPSFVDDQRMVRRFIQEARATLRLTHPHIARTHTIFQDRSTYYLAMEYLPGGSLADRLEGGPLPTEEVVRIASDLCRALAYAHGEGVVHCDIKPPNVLFDARGRARLADFGIAHVSADLMTRQFFTATGMAMGTVRYMAPEQLEGVRDDPRVDIYALGALLYEMLAGRPYLDFETESTPAAQVRNVQRIQTEPPPPLRSVNPQVPRWLAEVIDRALRKTPQDRFSSAEELGDALQRSAQRAERPASLPPTQLAAGLERKRRRGREAATASPPFLGGLGDRLKGVPVWGRAAAALALVALLIGGGMWLQRAIGGRPAAPPPATATLRSTSTPTAAPVPNETEGAPARPLTKPTQPQPTETQPSSAPTSTPRPTVTVRPSADTASTATPAPSNTPPATQAPTSVPATAPIPTFPEQGRAYRTPVTFRWEGVLAPGQAYLVEAWRRGTTISVQSPPLSGTSWTGGLPAEAQGEWLWRVSVVRNGSTVAASEERMFWFDQKASPLATPPG
jgi:serine/threonine-protein kinase